ncbi:hypothetical protein O3P69_006824 [Scylla paramamosain]|uniref:AAA+ ATPase domain-containing protein n=1 Tax=Scylla paramamosain TaxID=85552 RepID=A0AAW0U4S0_SCYPA
MELTFPALAALAGGGGGCLRSRSAFPPNSSVLRSSCCVPPAADFFLCWCLLVFTFHSTPYRMPTKQESITFPIRKTKSSRIKSGKLAEQRETQDARSHLYKCAEVLSDEIILDDSSSQETTSLDPPLGVSPRETVAHRRTSSRIQSTVHSTRRSSRKKCPISYRETSVSPQKKHFNVYNKDICTPKKLAYGEDSSPERVSTSDYHGTSVTPSKNTSSVRNVQTSSKKRDCVTSYRETNASPRRPSVRENGTSVQEENFTSPKKLSPEAISHTYPGTPSRSETPSRNAKSRDKDQEHLTPTKRRILSPDAADCFSPTKRLVVVLNGIPKEYSDKLPSLLSPSSKHQKAPELSTSKEIHLSTPPSPSQVNSCGASLIPSQTGPHNTSLVTRDSPVSKIEKPHSFTVPSLAAVLQAPDHTAQDSKATEKPHTSIDPSPTAVPHTPGHTAHHSKAECKSPSRSVVKRLNMNSPVKSPMKPLLLASPRRSPRKLNNENKASPQRSLMKVLQSPLQCSSPSSLVSRLSLASPPNCKKNLAMGLFKPNVSAYRSLRQSLNTGTPSVLVGREKQADEIREFLTHHLTQGKPGSLYISGAPGTGKTASLNSNLESLKVKRIKKVFLNCMTLKTTAAIYKTIASELSLSVSSSERENRNAIEKALATSRHPILLMLDEVDQLDSKNQEVLYTIFEWPALPCSSLVLVGIANSLDLTDRILPRLQALPNFKPKLLHFPPYTKAEIVKIITHRIKEANLGEVQVIRPAAIQLLAGKVASIAGDVRKALDVCRRAVELCETQARKQAVLKPSNASPQKTSKTSVDSVVPKMVEIPQILSIFNEVYGSRVVSAVTNAPESFPLQQKIVICCLLLILKHARSKDVTLGKVFDHSFYSKIVRYKSSLLLMWLKPELPMVVCRID